MNTKNNISFRRKNFLSAMCAAILLAFSGCAGNMGRELTLESLLDEMVSAEKQAHFPNPSYVCLQESSYDRASISPDRPGWFANNDGFGVKRVDTISGRFEKVMFDETGPGVITRIWITTLDKRGTWRFYFDGTEDPGLVIPAYDLMRMKIAGVGKGLVQPHTSYTPEGKGGNTSFLPIPFAKSCKITFEDSLGIQPTPKYYHINYRKYAPNIRIETFSEKVARRAEKKIEETDKKLLCPKAEMPHLSKSKDSIQEKSFTLAASDSAVLTLPQGENALYELTFDIKLQDSTRYAQIMRELILVAEFDGKQTVWVPLSDFSGGGMGAPYVESWYLSSDGKGKITSRWLMPYRKMGTIKLLNISSFEVRADINTKASSLKWDKGSLYFHASWRQENGIYIHNRPEESDKCVEWNFATIKGKGIYKGDLLSLFNHSRRWYGEGDEKIWVDDDTFPSHFGTGTEDYYNSSWAPVVPFHTPFGGAPRADMESSHGYNAFFRTRHLDGIPFQKSFKFDIEMLGWEPGLVDYATTIYWYGDYDAEALGTSGIQEAKQALLPTPPNPADYKIPNSIEFEGLPYTVNRRDFRVENQNMQEFADGKWSRAKHLLCPAGKPGDFIEFTFDNLLDMKYELILYATLANDYGILTFYVNGQPTNVTFDGYSPKVTNSKAIHLGRFSSQSGKLKLKVEIKGTNPQTIGAKYMLGLDCIQIVPIDK